MMPKKLNSASLALQNGQVDSPSLVVALYEVETMADGSGTTHILLVESHESRTFELAWAHTNLEGALLFPALGPFHATKRCTPNMTS